MLYNILQASFKKSEYFQNTKKQQKTGKLHCKNNAILSPLDKPEKSKMQLDTNFFYNLIA